MREAAAGRSTRDIVVVGASAGGLSALRRLAESLPAEYPGGVCVVVHLSPEARSDLPAILDRSGPLPAVAAEDGMPLLSRRIHVAPADRHLLIEGQRLRVVRGPTENRHRPAIDPLFRSAAWSHGPRTVGVVLSGHLDDGSSGLWAIKTCGGLTVVQEPLEAASPGMPASALRHFDVDHRLPVEDIARLLARVAQEPLEGPAPTPPPGLKTEIEFARLESDMGAVARLGVLSPFTCPACRGALWQIDEAGHLRYRCHTGHAYSRSTLLLEQDLAIERSIFLALRAVEEKAAALRKLAERWPDRMRTVTENYTRRADELDRAAETLRAMLAGQLPRGGASLT